MLTALAILAVIGALPSSRVELTLTGVNAAPVSAAPRSLSDVARELREGRKGVGTFSAVETTVPRNLPGGPPAFDWEEPEAAPEPEAVTEPPPTYVQTYLPASYGGRRMRVARRSHPTLRLATPPPERRPAIHPLAPPAFQARPAASGHFRQRPG
jgi:hypothetical protein